MPKIVVFDSGYGGEFFTDRLEDELGVIDVIRVIDWRNAEAFTKNRHEARKSAEMALRPYIGKVDLIILANYFLSITSLKYFERKYRNQKFVGLNMPVVDTFKDKGAMILTTAGVANTWTFYKYLHDLKRKNVKTVIENSWPDKIDEGDLTTAEVKSTIKYELSKIKFRPNEVILLSAQFYDIKEDIRNALGHNVKIYDGFAQTIREAFRVLGIRGGVGKKV